MDANGVEAVKVEPNRTGGSSARVGSEYTTPSNGGATDASVPRVSTPIESRGNNDPGGALSDNDDGDDSDTSSMSSTYSYSLPPPLPPSPKREVVRSGALDFKRHTHNSALEVLLGEPRIIIQTPEGETRASAAPIVKPNPRRIRIRSYLIKNVLEDLAREQGRTFIATGAVPPFPPIEFHMTFLQPFKLLSDLEAGIRAKARELEETAEAWVPPPPLPLPRLPRLPPPPHPVPSDSEDSESSRPIKRDRKGNCKECGRPMEEECSESITSQKKESRKTAKLRKKKHRKTKVMRVPPPPGAPPGLVLEHLKLLIEVFDNDLKPMFDLRREIRDGTLKRIAFDDLWHLFTVGQDVKLNSSGSRIYRVLRVTGGRPSFSPRPPGVTNTDSWSLSFLINAVYLDFQGMAYTPQHEIFAIPKYDGERPITSLAVYPVSLDPDHEQFCTNILRRSEKWLDLAQPGLFSHKHYSGLTLDEPNPEEVDSQIIVDNKMAYLQNLSRSPNSTSPPSGERGFLITHNHGETDSEPIPDQRSPAIENIHQDYQWDAQSESAYLEKHVSWLATVYDPAELKSEDKVLFPPNLQGFVLRTRKWATFDVDDIHDVTYPSGFDKLVLPPGHDKTVRALVARHAQIPSVKDTSSHIDSPSMDLVRGKGEGLVILLHGAPGVGKTSTAECVADTTKRPLFPITCGDIGDTATDVERNLEKSFQLAHKWGCVLLLDEADIFLQKRDKHDIKRNAIVSVFLRTLEYYRGILFLTTNRVGTFDPAFRSRIHISLFYPRLRKDATLKIWKMHLDRTQELKGDKLKFDRKEILEFAKDHYLELKKAGSGVWNGRQIRNAFQTAIALAEFQASEVNAKHGREDNSPRKHRVELSTEHFQTVAQTSKAFDLYLRSTLGGQTESDLAKREQTRLDEYSPSPKVRRRGRSDKEKSSKKGKVNVDSEDGDSEDTVEGSEDSEEEGSNGEDGSEEESKSEEVEVVKGKGKGKGKSGKNSHR